MSLVAPQVIVGGYPNAGALGAFSPSDIAGLQLWLDASDLSTITESGGAVSQWDDKSGNDRHATQGTAARQPALTTNIINGQPVIRFDGTDDIMQATPALGTVTGFTWFVVGKHRTTGTTATMVGASDGAYGSPDQFGVLRQNNGDNSVRLTDGTGGLNVTVNNGAADTSPHVFEFGFDGTAQEIDNIVDGSSASAAVAVSSRTFPAEIDLGGLDNDGTLVAFGDVDLSEVLIYTAFLSTTDRAAARQYLAAKWGITLS